MTKLKRMDFLRQIIVIICLVFVVSQARAQEPSKSVNISLITDSSSPSLLKLRDAVESEIQELLNGEFSVQFVKQKDLAKDWSLEVAKSSVDGALADPNIDMVIALGVLASNELAQRKNFSKPVFAPFIMNIDLQGLPYDNGVSGVKNLNYLTLATNVERDISLFQQIVPFKNLSILINGFALDMLPNLPKIMDEMVMGSDVEVTFVPVWESVDDVLNRLSPNTEAAFIMSLTQFSNVQLEALAEGLIDRNIPSFTMFRRRYLDNGFLASMSPDSDLPRLFRRLALNVQRVLLGEDAGSLNVHVSESNQLAVNMQTSKKLGLSPPWSILQDAELINKDSEQEEVVLTLREAIQRGIECNPGLAAAKKVINIGREEVNKVRSNLHPQVNVAGTYSRVDRDRAANSFGIRPETGIWGRAGFSQVLYSNKFMGDLKVERQLQRARCHGYEVNKLDFIQGLCTSYLNLLRAHTIVRIQRNNLNRTRAHLKLARQRVDVGVARSSEVYRWESQFASDLTNVTAAEYQSKCAEAALKRWLNYSQKKQLVVEEVTLDAPYWEKKKAWLEDHVTNDQSLELFIEFSAIEGVKHSDEIKKLANEIYAQAEVLGITKRAFWTPDVSLDAFGSQRAAEWGAGSKGKALFNRTDWMIGLNFTFPLYTGGYKTAAKRQACQELKRLKLQLYDLVDVEKTQVRTAAYSAVSSYTAINFSQLSAETAESNLALVQASYSKGVLPIVDLLDAQNQALVADLVTANAVYDFLIDLVVFQRYVNRFDFLAHPDDADRWIREIEHFFQLHKKGKK